MNYSEVAKFSFQTTWLWLYRKSPVFNSHFPLFC